MHQISTNVLFIFLFTGPSFVKEMRNVSVAVGRDATIDCHVSNAEDYKVTYTLIITKLKLSIDIFKKYYFVSNRTLLNVISKKICFTFFFITNRNRS